MDDKRWDDLIEAGWHVIDAGFAEDAFLFWKKKANDFLAEFMGPDYKNYPFSLKKMRPTEEVTRRKEIRPS